MTLEAFYQKALSQLQKAGVPTPEIDTRTIIGGILKLKPAELFLHKQDQIKILEAIRMRHAVNRRACFVPVAHILGYQYFFQDKMMVSNKTLIPRADTEHLVYAVQTLMGQGRPFQSALDIGTGTGAIAVSLSRLLPGACIDALDIHTAPARKNIKALGIHNVRLIRKSFFRFYPQGNYDLILSNPPYLSREDFQLLDREVRLYEPRRALYGGPDGLDFYRGIAVFASRYLNAGGYIIVETDHKYEAVKHIFMEQGFNEQKMFLDYNQLPRVLVIGK